MLCLCGGVIQCVFSASTFSKIDAKIQNIFVICKFWRENLSKKIKNDSKNALSERARTEHKSC